MPNSFGDTYNTGTMSLANGATTAIFTGSLLSTQAEIGDMIYVNNLVIYVSAVTDDTHLEVTPPWGGTSLVGVNYVLLKISKSRYDPALTQQKIRDMLTFYEDLGFFYFVNGSAPDPAVGIDGQWALKVNSGPWKVWYHTGGSWVLQGSPAGIQPKGLWNVGTTYALNDAVSWQGSLYSSNVAGNIGNQPDTSPTQWTLVMTNGDRYDIAFFDTDRPASGELVAKCEPYGVSFAAGLSQSSANAEVGATSTAVYSFRKNGTEFATLTFAAGGQAGTQNGTFACATTTTFGAGDIFTMYAPAVRDATLSGVGGNIVGFR